VVGRASKLVSRLLFVQTTELHVVIRRRLSADMLKPFNAIQIRVSIDDIAPPAWRRLIVPIDWNLEQLHLTIQAAFNWWNYHLHEFQIGGLRFGDAAAAYEGSCEDDPKVFEQTDVRLGDFMRTGASFKYLYDFGDSWSHTVELEQWLSFDVAPKTAKCVEGARARPPEDVGGILGYERFLEILADPSDPEHRETKQWCGGYFDPEWFDLATVDKDVSNALKPNVKRRLHQPKPRKA
jgi:hypothetical protein